MNKNHIGEKKIVKRTEYKVSQFFTEIQLYLVKFIFP